jgi:undecaprenyl-diphosphatase
VRPRLLTAGLALFAAYVTLTAAATRAPVLPFDLEIARAVQEINWGPLLPAFGALEWFEGIRQPAAVVLLLLLLLAINRRAIPFVVVCAASGAVYMLTEVLMRRPRPPAELVHVIRHTGGYSYPSGHAVFFTWFLTALVLVSIRRLQARAARAAAWSVAVCILFLVCTGRVYHGEHWPSDVLAGLVLGAGWTCVALSIRWLSDPVLDGQAAPSTRPAAIMENR